MLIVINAGDTMKRTMKTIAALVMMLGIGCIAASAIAHGHEAGEPSSIEMNMYLTVQFPTYPDQPPFTASARRANVIHWIQEKGKTIVRGEDFPRLVYSSDDAPGKLAAITAVIEGMPGTQATLDWTNYPVIRMSPVDLRVKIYDKATADLAQGDKPIVDIILSDLHLTTEERCAEGMCTMGYLDAENLEAQLVFTTELPQSNFAPYNEWLAGRAILGELRVKIPNPFRK